MMVHIHGIDPSCRERMVNGALLGDCWLTRASRAAQTAADVLRGNALAAASDGDDESAREWVQDAGDLEQIAIILARGSDA